MRPKILIAAGLVLAFVLGSMATGIYSKTSSAFNPAGEDAVASTGTVRTTPVVARTRFVEPARTVVAASRDTSPVVAAKNKRSWEREALIIGSGAGAGAAIGAVAGGKKGAGIGAISGGVAGMVYDLATRNK